LSQTHGLHHKVIEKHNTKMVSPTYRIMKVSVNKHYQEREMTNTETTHQL